MTLLYDTLTWPSSGTQVTHTDTDHSHRHLLCRDQYNCDDTDHSHRHLLCRHQYNCNDTDPSHRQFHCKCQYNCGDTDHSHRHLLLRHQYKCGDTGDTAHSHRQLLCKHQYNCGDTDHSQWHLLCKYQYNCGDANQLDTLSGPRLTHSPLWRAYRTTADGCGRSRTVADIDTTFREHSLTPRPPNETGTLATHSGKIWNMHETELFQSHLLEGVVQDVSVQSILEGDPLFTLWGPQYVAINIAIHPWTGNRWCFNAFTVQSQIHENTWKYMKIPCIHAFLIDAVSHTPISCWVTHGNTLEPVQENGEGWLKSHVPISWNSSMSIIETTAWEICVFPTNSCS